MAKSQFVSPDRLKKLLVFVTVAFIALLALAPRMPDTQTRTGFVVGWMIVFPIGCWMVLRTPNQT